MTPTASPTHARFGVLGFACSLSLITYLDRICIMRVVPHIQQDLEISEEQMGLVFSAFMLGYLLFEVPGGWLGDRWGARRVLSRIVLWWSLFTALTGVVWKFSVGPQVDVNFFGTVFALGLNSFVILMLIRFLFGCGEAGAYPNLSRVVGSWFPFGERGLALGSIWMSARIGGAIAPVVIGRLSDLVGWQQAFWFLGLAGVMWCVLFMLFFHNRPEDSPLCNEAERELIRSGPHSWEAHTAGAGHGAVPWRRMLLSPNLWFLCLAGFAVNLGWYFYPTWQPKFLEEAHGLDYSQTEWLTGLPFLCGGIGCLIGGRLSDWAVSRTGSRRWGRSLIGLCGFGGAGFCLLGAAHAPQAWQCVCLLSLATFINDLAVPVVWAVTTDIGGRFAGTVGGFVNMVGGIGGMITPSLIPVLKRNLPAEWSAAGRWQVILLVLASAFLVAGLSWLGIDASKPLFAKKEP